MPAANAREIVVELERVQVVERRAPVRSAYCRQCWCERDFVSVRDAARLFDVKAATMDLFAKSEGAHVRQIAGDDYLCSAAVFARMKACRNQPKFRLTG